MKPIGEILRSLDLQRLAGVNRILGVDLADDIVRIVELEKKGGPLNKYAVRMSPVCAYYRQFTTGATLEKKAQQTKELLVACGITTTYAVSSVRTLGVRSLVAHTPPHVDNLDEWIRENHERLLKLPVPLTQVSFDYEVINTSESSISVE